MSERWSFWVGELYFHITPAIKLRIAIMLKVHTNIIVFKLYSDSCVYIYCVFILWYCYIVIVLQCNVVHKPEGSVAMYEHVQDYSACVPISEFALWVSIKLKIHFQRLECKHKHKLNVVKGCYNNICLRN